MRLREITISGFRGFKDKQTLNLEENVILVRGLNGSGKSSFVEALEWLFFDEISRKKKSFCKSEYVGEFLRNLHCEKTLETYVEVLADIGGKEVRLKKKWMSPQKNECYVDDSPVKDFSALGISFAGVYKPILAQVEIKHYVETDPKDRWEETNKILGLGVLSEFRTALQELLNSKKKESRYESSRKVLYGLESDLKEFSELQGLSKAIAHRPFSMKTFEEELIKSITNTYSLETKLIDELSQSIDREILKSVQRDEKFENIQALTIPDHTTVDYPQKSTEDLEQIFHSLKEMRTANVDFYKFLEIGKRLIEDATCPFCLEKTLTDKKLELVDKRMKETKSTMELSSEISANLEKLRQLKREMDLKITASLDISIIEKVKVRILRDVENTIEAKKMDSMMKQSTSFSKIFARFNKELECLIDESALILEGTTQFDEAKIKSGMITLKEDAKRIKHVLSEIRDNLQSLFGTLIAETSRLSTEEKTELNKALLFRRIVDHLEDIKHVGIYESDMNQILDLIEKVEKFEKYKSKKLLESLNKQIKKFYSRLNPGEKIGFFEISPTKGRSRRIRIKATSYGKAMNPVSCFSESHMNCLCLSIYFSQRILRNPYWKFVILDDPIQSMDENHAKNLIRILVEIAKEKQVVVLSHNAKFCQDFRDLFYGTDYLFYEFSGYSKTGPRIELKQAPLDAYISIARSLHSGNMEERANAANNLRKAIERLTLDMLIYKGKKGRGKASELKLDERLEKIEILKLLVLEEIGEIKAVLKVCDAGSHEPPRREITPEELLDGIATIENLASKHLE